MKGMWMKDMSMSKSMGSMHGMHDTWYKQTKAIRPQPMGKGAQPTPQRSQRISLRGPPKRHVQKKLSLSLSLFFWHKSDTHSLSSPHKWPKPSQKLDNSPLEHSRQNSAFSPPSNLMMEASSMSKAYWPGLLQVQGSNEYLGSYKSLHVIRFHRPFWKLSL